jgi:glyoxylase-like metal-dependent hydrolase (beta-lactamase superfamily II)
MLRTSVALSAVSLASGVCGHHCATTAPSAATQDRDARAIIEAALGVHGATRTHPPVSVRCEGRWNELGHYSRPRELREYVLTRSLTFDFVRGEIRATGRLSHPPEAHDSSVVVGRDRLEWLDFGDADLQADTSEQRIRTRYRLAEAVPSLLLELALEEPARMLSLGSSQADGKRLERVAFTDGGGVLRTLHFDVESHRLVRLERLEHDPLFGDDRQSTDYVDYRLYDGLLVATELRRRRLWFTEEEVTCAPAADAVAVGPFPARRAVGVEPPRAEVRPIGHGLFVVLLPHLNNRTMFMELADYVVAFEAPLSSATGDLLARTIREVAHGKPIRYLALSHHHPDYVGGIRPFVAGGTAILTTAGSVDYVKEIAAASRTVEPDEQARVQAAVKVETVQGMRTIGEGAHVVRIFDIGRYTGHTEEYLVYYFPEERALFEGDLVSPAAGPPRPAGKRAQGLLRAIEDLGIDVDRIYESWPLKNTVDVLPIAGLRQMVGDARELELAAPDR